MKIITKQEEIKKLEEGIEVIETVEKEYISIPQPSTLIDKEEYIKELTMKIEDDQKEINRRTESKMKLEAELEEVQLLVKK